MAYISIVSKTTSSITVQLVSLDESWNGATRTVNWYIGSAGGNIPTENAYSDMKIAYISGSPSSGGKVTFSGLKSGTEYGFYCTVYHGSNFLAEKTAQATTEYDDSGDTTDEWTLRNYASQRDFFSIWDQFRAGECFCIPVTFSYSGKAIFYCDSSNNGEAADMLAFLSTSKNFDTDVDVGEPMSYLIYNDDSSKDYNNTMTARDFGFEYNVTAGVTYYLFVRENLVSYYPGYIKIVCVAPAKDIEYFEWSSAVAQGKPIKNVSHTEWDSFIDKIIEVLTDKGMLNQPLTSSKYGYATGTTYRTMLNDCYLTYDTASGGYPLTAKKFNVARFLIGSTLPAGSTTGIGDKTSKSSKVLASDFITLENCLKTIQETI